MQINRKTRRGFSGKLIKLSIKLFISISLLIIVILVISRLDLPTPVKSIKQEVPNEKFKVVK